MIRLFTLGCFVFGLCLTLLSGWHWSRAETNPEANWILWIKRMENGQAYLYRTRWDGLVTKNLTPSIQSEEIHIIAYQQTIIFDAIGYAHGAIYRMGLDGSNLQNLTKDLDFASNPMISPDEKWILFTGEDNGSIEIYRMKLDGSNLQKLTQSSRQKAVSAITSDNEWVIFGEDFSIYRMHLDGSEQRNIASSFPYARFSSLSPDGQWVIFVSDYDGNEQVFRMHLDDSKPLNLVQSRWNSGFLAISPDSKSILFYTLSDNYHGIYRTEIANAQQADLTPDNEWDDFYTLSADGQWILYGSRPYWYEEIYRMRWDGSQKERLTYFEEENFFAPRIVPNTEWIFFEFFEPNNQSENDLKIYRMKIDGSEKEHVMSINYAQDSINGFIPMSELPFHPNFTLGLGVLLMLGASLIQLKRSH
jgi:Tol biopolymer transport system component